jgi:hypothetical protein
MIRATRPDLNCLGHMFKPYILKSIHFIAQASAFYIPLFKHLSGPYAKGDDPARRPINKFFLVVSPLGFEV